MTVTSRIGQNSTVHDLLLGVVSHQRHHELHDIGTLHEAHLVAAVARERSNWS